MNTKLGQTKLQQNISLTLILNFYGTLTENWNNKFNKRKKNQKLKYMNKGSTHINAMSNSIPSGIFNRLAKITSRTKNNAQTIIDKKH